jgi:hypothetical protein
VHAGGAGIPGDGGNDVFRLAPPQNQLTAVLAQRGVQIAQAPVPERHPWSSRRQTQRIVEYEERDYPPRVGSSGQRRMVLQPQVAAKPHHRSRQTGHMASLPVAVLELTETYAYAIGTGGKT